MRTNREMDVLLGSGSGSGSDDVGGISVIPGDSDNLALCAIITVAMQLCFYLVACTCKFDKVTDLAGASNFVVLALVTFGLSGVNSGCWRLQQHGYPVSSFLCLHTLRLGWWYITGIAFNSTDNSSLLNQGINVILLGRLFQNAVSVHLVETYCPRQIIITDLVTIWGSRLGGYLLIRIIDIGKDSRFDKIRESPIKFLFFWIFQIIWVFTVSLPVIFINSPVASQRSTSAADVVGAVVFFVGFLCEAVADHQKSIFKKDPLRKDKWCDIGLWKISRHPNYLGEICVWWGAFIISATILDGAKWVAVFSPLFVMVTLLFFTGIPLLERRADKNHGNDPDYIKYKKSTPPLLPGIPPLYRHTPYCLKLVFCCEFPIYHSKPEPNPYWEDGTIWDKGSGAIIQPPRPSTNSTTSGMLYTPINTSSQRFHSQSYHSRSFHSRSYHSQSYYSQRDHKKATL